MSLFLITFLSLYGGMHVYAFARLRGAFSLGQQVTALLAGWMVLMTVAPLLVRIAEGAGHDRTATWLAWAGYIWMGSIFIFCTTLAAADSIRAAVWLSHRFCNTAVPGFLTAAITCEIALFLTLIASGYSLYEARRIRTDHVVVTTDKLPPTASRIRIVQISDVHVGLLFRESRLESVLQAVRAAKPDILVSTGDLVDGRLSREDVLAHFDKMAALIAEVPTKGGKFAVTGNHENYAGLDQALEFTRKAGFTLLRDQSVTLPEGITISGVDDVAGRRKGQPIVEPPELKLLQSLSQSQFQILLKHRPLVVATSSKYFDLQLSGHVHKGQIFPFNLLVRLNFPIPCGTTTLANNSKIHVSRGSGTWGPPMRLFAPPEVTVIDISSTTSGR
ncbi:MAG: metallophosphoesterase [Desulfuromonadales bacterium]|nr:metallophosphoesterase [Desulfuromonadales bacterium]